jgi:hypothetical protein
MNRLYSQIAERAGHRCEYCRAPEAIFNFPFEVEHLIPPGRGGTDEISNLALSCRSCNLFKRDAIEAVDRQTGSRVSLFNPRRELWDEHFAADQKTGNLMALTSVARATIDLLQMNGQNQVAARKQWMKLKLFP